MTTVPIFALAISTALVAATVASTETRIALLAGQRQSGALVITHGGVGSPPALADGPQAAADTALRVLLAGGASLDAAIAGTVRLENDPRFNAGTGANIRLDGKTIQMDAAVMTGEGHFGAVAGIERVLNPVLVARAVMDSTPHILLVGQGATRFAHRIGFADMVPRSAEAEAKYQARMKRQAEVFGRADTTFFDWRRYWNFPGPMPADVLEWRRHAPRDVPIFGAGLYAGPAGAVACTGEGEEIVRSAVARSVYERMANGTPARQAIEEAVKRFPQRYDLGLIAVDRVGWGVAGNKTMAYGVAGK